MSDYTLEQQREGNVCAHGIQSDLDPPVCAACLRAEIERLQGELDRPKHETLRQLADVVERYEAQKAEIEAQAARAVKAEQAEGRLMGEIERLREDLAEWESENAPAQAYERLAFQRFEERNAAIARAAAAEAKLAEMRERNHESIDLQTIAEDALAAERERSRKLREAGDRMLEHWHSEDWIGDDDAAADAREAWRDLRDEPTSLADEYKVAQGPNTGVNAIFGALRDEPEEKEQ